MHLISLGVASKHPQLSFIDIYLYSGHRADFISGIVFGIQGSTVVAKKIKTCAILARNLRLISVNRCRKKSHEKMLSPSYSALIIQLFELRILVDQHGLNGYHLQK
jgi:hypothetical protein